MDTARFRATDSDELVVASLACPLCLHVDDVEWKLDVYGYDPSARCACGHCARAWRVYLTAQQALRLGLMALPASS